MAGTRLCNQQGVDFVLRHGVAAALFGNRNIECFRIAKRENRGIDEPIMDDHIGRREGTRRLDRQQVRIAGTGAHKYDSPRFHDTPMPPSSAMGNAEKVAHGLVKLDTPQRKPVLIVPLARSSSRETTG